MDLAPRFRSDRRQANRSSKRRTFHERESQMKIVLPVVRVSSFVSRVVRGLALAVVLGCPTLPYAADLSRPHILVATPELRDGTFRCTVLVVTAVGGDQHIGFIVNRPTGVTLGKIFPEHGPSQNVTDSVYFGGPVGAEVIFALVQRAVRPPGNSFELLSGLYLVADAADVDRVIEFEAVNARF